MTLNAVIALILRFFVFVVREIYNVTVKKFTFAVSSRDELLVLRFCSHVYYYCICSFFYINYHRPGGYVLLAFFLPVHLLAISRKNY